MATVMIWPGRDAMLGTGALRTDALGFAHDAGIRW